MSQECDGDTLENVFVVQFKAVLSVIVTLKPVQTQSSNLFTASEGFSISTCIQCHGPYQNGH